VDTNEVGITVIIITLKHIHRGGSN